MGAARLSVDLGDARLLEGISMPGRIPCGYWRSRLVYPDI
jgi:hypothetical protein